MKSLKIHVLLVAWMLAIPLSTARADETELASADAYVIGENSAFDLRPSRDFVGHPGFGTFGGSGGEIHRITGAFNSGYKTLTLETVFGPTPEGKLPNAFFFAMSDGDNPALRGDHGYVAIFYVDLRGTTPILTVYAYSGGNNPESWRRGAEWANGRILFAPRTTAIPGSTKQRNPSLLTET